MPEPARKQSTGALNTLHQSLSPEEWRRALAVVKARRVEGVCETERRSPQEARHQVVKRCLLRVDRGEDAAPGLYVVRSQDLSDGGMRLIHGGPIKPETICCVIIETEHGPVLAVGGMVAWCRPIEGTSPPAYELGLRFYQPIQSEHFLERAGGDEAAA